MNHFKKLTDTYVTTSQDTDIKLQASLGINCCLRQNNKNPQLFKLEISKQFLEISNTIFKG